MLAGIVSGEMVEGAEKRIPSLQRWLWHCHPGWFWNVYWLYPVFTFHTDEMGIVRIILVYSDIIIKYSQFTSLGNISHYFLEFWRLEVQNQGTGRLDEWWWTCFWFRKYFPLSLHGWKGFFIRRWIPCLKLLPRDLVTSQRLHLYLLP